MAKESRVSSFEQDIELLPEPNVNFHCQFIRAGDQDGDFTPEALQDAVSKGLFDRRAVFVEQPGKPYGLHDLVGVTGQAVWNPDNQAVEGVIRFYSDMTPNLVDIKALSVILWPEPGNPAAIRHVESINLKRLPIRVDAEE